MGTHFFEIDGMHLIRLTRNAVFGEMPGVATVHHADERLFSMFDYYCSMRYYKVDRNVKYTSFVGIEDPKTNLSHPAFSEQLLTLIELKDTPKPKMHYIENPFTYDNPDKPFLVLINVTVTPAERPEDSCFFSKKFEPTPFQITEFLKNCVTQMNEVLVKVIASYSAGFRIYYSLSSGNFYIAMRTDNFSLAYRTAMMVGSMCYSGCVFHTFTVLGIEYRLGPDGIPMIFKEISTNSNVVVRLTVNNNAEVQRLMEVLQSYYKPNGRLSDNRNIGLNGRYDISLRLTFRNYRWLFPFLSSYKFETRDLSTELKSTLQKIDQELKDDPEYEVVACIAKGIIGKKYRIINERILYDVDFDDNLKAADFSAQPNGNKAIPSDAIWSENLALIEKANRLKNREYQLRYEKRPYKEWMKLIIDMIKTYCSARYDFDTLINGYLFKRQIDIVLDSVESQLDSIHEMEQIENDPDIEDRFKTLCEDLVECMRIAVNSLNSYNKLLQSINQQSMQSPNYEISTRLDPEKYLIAYTEFLQSFTSDYFRKNPDDGPDLFPIFMIDYAEQFIIARLLFASRYTYDRKQKALVYANSGKSRERPLLVTIHTPSYNTFACLYETLPFICHEISHNFSFSSPAENNALLVKSVLSKLSVYLTSFWISKSNNDKYFHNLASFERLISSTIYDSFDELYDASGDDSLSSAMLKDKLNKFFLDKFFIRQDDYSSSNPEVNSRDTLVEIFRKLIQIGHLYDDSKIIEEFVALSKNDEPLSDDLKSELEMLALKASGNCHVLYIERGVSGRIDDLINTLTDLGDVKVGDLKNRLEAIKITSSTRDMDLYIDFSDIIAINDRERFENDCTLFYDKTLRWLVKISEILDSHVPDIQNTVPVLEKSFPGYDVLRKIQELIKNNQFSEAVSLYGKQKVTEAQNLPESSCLLRAKNGVLGTSATDEFKSVTLGLIKENIKSFFHFINDINYLYLNAQALLQAGFFSTKSRDFFISSVHSKLRRVMAVLNFKSDTIESILVDSKEINAMLSSLCYCFVENDAPFRDSLKQALFLIDGKAVNGIIGDTIALYGEVLADLTMCAAMQFSAFGYLRFFVQSFLKVRQLDNMESFDMERMSLVASVLLANTSGDHDAKAEHDMLTSIGDYLSHTVKKLAAGYVINYTISDIGEDELLNYIEVKTATSCADGDMTLLGLSEQTTFLKNLLTLYRELKESIGENLKFHKSKIGMKCTETGTSVHMFNNNTQDFFGNYFINPGNRKKDHEASESMNVDRDHYYVYIKRLESIVIAADEICGDQTDFGKPMFMKDYHDIFEKKIKGKNGCAWEKDPPPMLDVRKEIANYYNTVRFNNLSKEDFFGIFKQCLPFVFYYYYLNRQRYGSEIFPDDTAPKQAN